MVPTRVRGQVRVVGAESCPPVTAVLADRGEGEYSGSFHEAGDTVGMEVGPSYSEKLRVRGSSCELMCLKGCWAGVPRRAPQPDPRVRGSN